MRIKTKLISGVACTFIVAACGKDSDKKVENKPSQVASLVYPSTIEGKYVSVAGWELTLPVTNKDAEYRWGEALLSEAVVTDEITLSVPSKDGQTKSEFIAKLTADQCQEFKFKPADGDIGGTTEKGINWFLKNNGKSFETFTAIAKFNSCLAMTVRPVDKSFSAVAEDSDLLRYLEIMADGIKFNRFSLVRAGYQRISPFLFTSFGQGMTLVTDDQGITSGSSENTVFTQDARLNILQSEAKAGDCRNPVFQNAWNDSTMKDAESVNKGLVGKEKAGVEAAEGKHTWVTQGVFKTETGTKCLILKFSLKKPVASEEVLKTDKELETKLAFELGLTQLDGVPQ